MQFIDGDAGVQSTTHPFPSPSWGQAEAGSQDRTAGLLHPHGCFLHRTLPRSPAPAGSEFPWLNSNPRITVTGADNTKRTPVTHAATAWPPSEWGQDLRTLWNTVTLIMLYGTRDSASVIKVPNQATLS